MAKIALLAVFGTRPEAIKMAPVIQQLQQDKDIELKVCVTGQHRQMLDQVLSLLDIHPDFDLDLMQQTQTLPEMTANMLTALSAVFSQFHPACILVHGDTTSSFTAALAGFYHRIPVAHIEAGLRTETLASPFPEEGNRRLTAVLADYHFAPTAQARDNLYQEGKSADRVWLTGNTGIDGLYHILQKIRENPPLRQRLQETYPFLKAHKRLILVTTHRRENIGQGIMHICQALVQIATRHPDVQLVYPVHLNPQIAEPVKQQLAGIENIILLPPQDYVSFVYLMQRCDLIMSDSGGIQEEAPALGKPVVLLREQTERPEAVETGVVQLVGTDVQRIVQTVERLLQQPPALSPSRLYGDGNAASRIVAALKQVLGGANAE